MLIEILAFVGVLAVGCGVAAYLMLEGGVPSDRRQWLGYLAAGCSLASLAAAVLYLANDRGDWRMWGHFIVAIVAAGILATLALRERREQVSG